MPETEAVSGKPVALIVDDEATIRTLVAQVLQLKGFAVVEAADGAAALTFVAQAAPSVILLDARLPDASGFNTCAAIRRMPNGRTVPILMMTGMDAPALHAQALDAGCTDIIGKPLKLLELGERLRTLVEAAAATQP